MFPVTDFRLEFHLLGVWDGISVWLYSSATASPEMKEREYGPKSYGNRFGELVDGVSPVGCQSVRR